MKHTWLFVVAFALVAACSRGNSSGDETGTDASTRDAFVAPPDGTYPCRANGDGKTTLVFINRCSETLTVRGSDIPNATVAAGAFSCQDIGTDEETLSAKRYWGYLSVDPGAEHHTLAEFTFNTDFHDFDWYNISHVDAHNLTMQVAPLDRTSCQSLTCADTSLLTDCPAIGRQTDGEGELIACVSPDRDNATSPVALHFESCEEGYAWSGDDQHGTDKSPVRACAGEDFAIVFCP